MSCNKYSETIIFILGHRKIFVLELMKVSLVAYACNPSPPEAEAGGLPRDHGQCGLHSKTLFQKQNTVRTSIIFCSYFNTWLCKIVLYDSPRGMVMERNVSAPVCVLAIGGSCLSGLMVLYKQHPPKCQIPTSVFVLTRGFPIFQGDYSYHHFSFMTPAVLLRWHFKMRQIHLSVRPMWHFCKRVATQNAAKPQPGIASAARVW